MPLKTDYTNDILNTDINVERKYVIKDNNGSVVVDNVTIEDVTAYTREGSRFGANDINATNTAVNELNDSLNKFNWKYYGQTQGQTNIEILENVSEIKAISLLPDNRIAEIIISKEAIDLVQDNKWREFVYGAYYTSSKQLWVAWVVDKRPSERGIRLDNITSNNSTQTTSGVTYWYYR